MLQNHFFFFETKAIKTGMNVMIDESDAIVWQKKNSKYFHYFEIYLFMIPPSHLRTKKQQKKNRLAKHSATKKE